MLTMFLHLNSFGLVLLERTLEERVEITFDEYVVESQEQYKKEFGDRGLAEWFGVMNASLDRVKKRLGAERHKIIKDIIHGAFLEQERSGDMEKHKEWIEFLLKDYYDPMYEYQMGKSTREIAFKGNAAEVIDYLNTLG